jgi:hypothetical protein
VNLKGWMDKNDADILKTAETFGVSIHAVKKWLRGDRSPRDKMKAKIAKLTKGAVTANDWVSRD